MLSQNVTFRKTSEVSEDFRSLGAMAVALGLVVFLLLAFPWVAEGTGNLEITKAAPSRVEAGEVLGYTITVTNNTGEAITNVQVVDLVPTYATYISGSMNSQTGVFTPTPPVSIVPGSSMTWTIGSLAAGSFLTMTFQVTAASPLLTGTHILNTATISGSSDTATTTVQSAAELVVTKSVTPKIAGPGSVVEYTIWITNVGNGIAEHVIVTDVLSPGFDPPQKVWSGLTVTGSKTLTLTATAPVTEGVYYNGVAVAYGRKITDTGPTAPVVVEVRRVYLPLVIRNYPLLELSWHQGDGTAGSTVYSVAACQADCDTLYAGTRASGVYKSQDGGRTWPLNGLAGEWVNWVAVQPDTASEAVLRNCDVAYAATWGLGVQKTTDGGLNWTPANAGLGDLFLYILAIAPDGQTLYAGTARNGVYKSADGGGSWSPASAGLPAGALVDALAIDPDDPQVLYAGTWGQGVYRSTTAGGLWSEVNNGLGDLEIYALAIEPGDTLAIYAATHNQGVYRSGDGGGSWTENGLPGRVVYTVAVDEDGIAYAGTDGTGDGNGAYQRSVGGVWEAMAAQPGVALAVRNLTLCESSLLAGTTDGAWWYGPD